MLERVFEYGAEYKAEVISSSKAVIGVHATEINEGFLLLGHGIEQLPKVGDKCKIVFEKDGRRGHWEWYPDNQ